MTAATLKGFVNDGYLSNDVIGGYDPYYEPNFATAGDNDSWNEADHDDYKAYSDWTRGSVW